MTPARKLRALRSGVFFFAVKISILSCAGQTATTITPTAGFGTGGSISTLGSPGSQTVTIPANLGQQRGANLFQSFTTFNVGSGDTALFTQTGLTTPMAIRYIIARVTGGASTINGNLTVDPASPNFAGANFFFINPSGVMFGNGASINVPGNFVVSTADFIKLSDGTGIFYSNPLSGADNLTAASVQSFGFFKGETPAPITVSGNANLNHEGTGGLQFVGGNFTAAPGATLAVNSSVLSIFSGGATSATANETVPYLTGPVSNYSGATFANFGTVTLGRAGAGGAKVAVNGAGGSLVIRGGRLVVQGGSAISSANTTASAGSNIEIEGDSLLLNGGSTISSSASGSGAGGQVSITTHLPDQGGVPAMLVDGAGSAIQTASTGTGAAGSLAVTSTGTLDLADGGSIASGGACTSLDVVNLTLDSASTIAQSNGGALDIIASGSVLDAGTIEALGAASNSSLGGNLVITGANVKLTSTSMTNVSGNAGGGSVFIGGGPHGADANVPDAQTTTVDPGAQILADALLTGDGGKVVVWSNNDTEFNGHISSQALGAAGNGGQVEVSGGYLNFRGTVNTLAAHGTAGGLLLDPYSISIVGGSTDSQTSGTTSPISPTGTASSVSWTTLEAALGTGNVTVTTDGTGTTGTPPSGNITVQGSATYSSAHTLTLAANENMTNPDDGSGGIFFNDGVSVSNTGAGGLNLNAGTGGVRFGADGAATGTVLNFVGGVSINTTGTIVENGATAITAGSLSTSSVGGTTLAGANQVASFGASNTTSGDVTFANSATALTITGISQAGGGKVKLTASGGTVSIGGAISAGTGNVTLNAAGAVTQSAALTGAGLELLGAGPFTLTNSGNSFTTLASAATGAVTYVNSGALTVGAVNSTTGITSGGASVTLQDSGAFTITNAISSAGGAVSLTSSGGTAANDTIAINGAISTGAGNLTLNAGGAVTQTAALTATTGGLELKGTGAYTLTNSGNSFTTLASGATGTVSYASSGALTVGAVNSTTGITSGGASVTLQDSGAFTITNAISSSGGSVSLTSSGGTAANDTITINGAISTGAGNLTLNAAGAVTQSAALTSTTGGLELKGAGAYTLTNSGNSFATIASGATGAVTYVNSGALTVGAVNSTTGITSGGAGVTLQDSGALTITNAISSSGGSVSLTSSGGTAANDTITINGAISTGAGNLTLSAGGAVTQSAALTSTTGGLELKGAGAYMLTNSGNSFATLASAATGAVSYVNSGGLAVGAVNSTTGITSGGASVSLTTNTAGTLTISDAISVGAGNLTLNAAGAVTQSAAVSGTGLELLGGGPYTLTNSGNSFTTLASGATGTVSYVNSGALTVGAVNSTTGITSGGASVTLQDSGAFTITNAISSSGGSVSLTSSGGTAANDTITINGAISTGAGNLTLNAGGAVTQSAALTSTTGGLELKGAGAYMLTNSGNSFATIASGATGTVNYVNSGALTVGAVNSTTGITSGGASVSLTTNTAGTLTISNAIAVGVGNLTLNAAGAVTQSAAVSGTGLELLGAGPFTLTNGSNSFTTLASGATGAASYVNSGALTVGAVNATTGITSGGASVVLATNTSGTLTISDAIAVGAGNLTLNAAGAVTQSAAISGTGLELLGAGPYTLTNSGNSFTTLASGATGAVNYVNSSALAVGAVNATTGITSAGAGVTLQNSGALTITNAISSSGGNVSLQSSGGTAGNDTITINGTISTGAGNLTLNAAGAVTQSAALTATTGGLELKGAGAYTLTNSGNSFATLASAATGAVNYVNSGALTVGAVNATTGITSGGSNVTLATNTSGTLTISNAISVGAGNLSLNAAGAVTQSAAISGTGLELLGAGPYTLTNGGNSFTTLASGATGAVNYVNSGALSVGVVNATTGVTSGGASLTLQTGTGTLSIIDPVNAGSGNVTLTGGGAVSESGLGTITGNLLTTSSHGGTTLAGANTVASFNATNDTSGDINLANTATTLTVTGVSQSGGGNVLLNNTGALALTTAAVSAAANGSITLTSTGAQSLGQAVTAGGTGTVTLNNGGAVSGAGLITANTLTLEGTGGVGASGSAIKTQLSTLTLNTPVAATGSIYISDAGGALALGGTVGGSSSQTLNVTETAGGITVNSLLTNATGSGSVINLSGTSLTLSSSINGGTGAVNVNNTGSVTIDNSTGIQVTGNGSIDLAVTGKIINSGTISAQSGTVTVGTTGDIAMTGGVIETQTSGSGDSGAISVSAGGTLSLDGGGLIESRTTGNGNAGSVMVTAGIIDIGTAGPSGITLTAETPAGTGNVPLSYVSNTGILSLSQASGNAGNVTVISTNTNTAKTAIDLENGGQIGSATTTASSGNAGNVSLEMNAGTLTAGVSQIAATPTVYPVIFSTAAGSGTQVQDGTITIAPQSSGAVPVYNLVLNGGASIQSTTQNGNPQPSSTSGTLPPGSITVIAQNVTLSPYSTIESDVLNSSTGYTGRVFLSVQQALSIDSNAYVQTVLQSGGGPNQLGQVSVVTGSLTVGGPDHPLTLTSATGAPYLYSYSAPPNGYIPYIDMVIDSTKGQSSTTAARGVPIVEARVGGNAGYGPAQDQIILDGTLVSGTPDNLLSGTSGPVQPVQASGTSSIYTYDINPTDGVVVGNQNLFLSFSEFNLNSNETVVFSNTPKSGPSVPLQNIVARVTGNSGSVIYGSLQEAAGTTANLFLLNPNGFIFNGSQGLQLYGALTISTATSANFGSGTFYTSGNTLSDVSLKAAGLSASPSAFTGAVTSYGFDPALIPAGGTSFGSITFNSANFSNADPNNPLSAIKLIGGNVLLENGSFVSANNIVLYSAANSAAGAQTIALDSSGNPELPATGVAGMGSVNLTGNSILISTQSGSGAPATILVSGNTFGLTDSFIIDQNFSPAASTAEVAITASNVTIAASSATSDSYISTTNLSSGTAAPVVITAENLTVNANGSAVTGIYSTAQPTFYFDIPTYNQNLNPLGAYLVIASPASSYSYTGAENGSAGTITLHVSGTLNVENGGILTATTYGLGAGGTITIDGLAAMNPAGLPGGNPQVLLQTGSSITSATSLLNPAFPTQTGDAGSVVISASSLSVSGSSIVTSAGLSTTPNDTASADTGNGGSITINISGTSATASLTNVNNTLAVTNGGLISASSYTSGKGGTIQVGQTSGQVPASITIDGSGLASPTGIFAEEFGAGSASTGTAILLSTSGALLLEGGGEISANAAGNGSAGDIAVTSGSLTVDGTTSAADEPTGILSATTGAGVTGVTGTTPGALGNGGNITVSVSGLLSIVEGGQISASSYTAGEGGNITVNEPGTVSIASGGEISASSYASGTGGTIQVGQTNGQVPASITIDGSGLTSPTGIFAEEFGAGSASTGTAILLSTSGALLLEGGGEISANAAGNGSAGDIAVTSGSLTVDGTTSAANELTGILSATTGAGLTGVAGTTPGATGNGGNITVNVSGTVSIVNGGQISASSYTAGKGGTIQVGPTAGGVPTSVTINGTGSSGAATGIFAGENGSGDSAAYGTTGAAISLTTGLLTVENAGQISTQTTYTGPYQTAPGANNGNAGDIAITCLGSSDQAAPTSLSVTLAGQISSATSGVGQGGNVSLTVTGDAAVTEGGAISASSANSAAASGLSGEITINQSGSTDLASNADAGVWVDGTGSTISTVAGAQTYNPSAPANAKAGDITLNTEGLTVSGTGTITSSTLGPYKAGDIYVNSSPFNPAANPAQFVNLKGAGAITSDTAGSGNGGTITIAANALSVAGAGTEISTSTSAGGNGGTITVLVSGTVGLANGGKLAASSTAAANGGDGGSIYVGCTSTVDNVVAWQPQALDLSNGATINCGSLNTNGGSIKICAGDVDIQHESSVQTTAAGNGGDITITATLLFYLNDYSFISTHAGKIGGNITIDPQFTILNHSYIDAFGGTGDGNVIIDSNFLLSGDSTITASGTVSIDSVPLDLTGSLVPLPADLTDEELRLRESCARSLNNSFSSLVVVGRGGIETAPDELNSDSGFDSVPSLTPSRRRN
jgi:filamentous hemagglutinin family protein